MSNLASLCRKMGNYERALELNTECLEARRRTLGDVDPSTLSSINNLAALHGSMCVCARARACDRLHITQ